MLHDTLADVLSNIKNYEDLGKSKCIVKASKTVKNVLKVMQDNNYIGSFEFIDDEKGGKFKVKLIGKINKCCVIKPRYSVKLENFAEKEKDYLPGNNTGILVVSTTFGIMSHRDAIAKKTGGILLAYVY